MESFIASLKEAGIISLDLETTGLNVFSDRIVGISISIKSKEAFYLPLSHGIGINLDSSEVLPLLKPVLEGKRIIGHNIKFDYKFLLKEGIDLNVYSDTMLLSSLDDVNQSLSLKDLALRYFGVSMTRFSDLFFRRRKNTIPNIADLSPDDVYLYACADADMCLRLYRCFLERNVFIKPSLLDKIRDYSYALAPKDFTLPGLYTLERNLIKTVAHMELNGISVNRSSLEENISEITDEINLFKSSISDLASSSIDLNSNQQVANLLYNELKLPYKGSITKSKIPSVATPCLKRIEDSHPVVKALIEYRTLVKQKGMLEGYLSAINPTTNAIHTSFLQWHVPSGRFASSGPNLQNVPDDLRRHFISRESYTFVNFDYSQIEYRVIASLANEKPLIKAFNEDKDIHRQTASMLFDVPYESVSDDQRKRGKMVGFALLYGMDSFGLSDRLKMDRASAKKFLEDYFNAVPMIKSFIDVTHKQVIDLGYVETHFGRRRYIPEARSKDRKLHGYGLRSAVSHRIQGSASDILKFAMLRVTRDLNLKPAFNNTNPIKLLLTIHDSLLFEVQEGISLEEFKQRVLKCMQINIFGFCKLSVSCTAGQVWSDMTVL
ncbi:MAG: hypothetical protein A2231_11355 [Candidatus Firestonebacteria bacterium RIFOXYA2_FULL_40_8]|nr:MAG: hypothetical protein A2231_11355 [Candidatus Firestonebacteria bacterium RIFOXYA2_FULL_40_8]